MSGTGRVDDYGAWWRVSLSSVNNSSGNTIAALQFYPNIDGVGSAVCWGLELEQGAFPTSYIPTVGSVVTRTADSLTMTGTNFSSWFNASEGTFLSQYVFSNASSGIGMVYEAATDGSNNHNVFRNGTSLVASTTNGAVQQAGFTLTDPVSSGTVYTSAYAYKVNDFAGCLNGGSVQTDISGTLPTVNALGLGVRPFDGSLSLNGWLRSLRYYPRRLTNAQLQVLT